MKTIILCLVSLVFCDSMARADNFDNGTITEIDGIDKFTVKTEKHGTMTFTAGKYVLDPAAKDWRVLEYPHAYPSLKVGDYIKVIWGGGRANRIADGVRIVKRAD